MSVRKNNPHRLHATGAARKVRLLGLAGHVSNITDGSGNPEGWNNIKSVTPVSALDLNREGADDKREMDKAIKRIVRLETSRGHLFRAPIQDGPYRRLSAVDVLLDRGSIAPDEKDAAEKYGQHYRLTYDVGRCAGSLEQVYESGNFAILMADHYGGMLAAARKDGLKRNRDLIWICDQACGALLPWSAVKGYPWRIASLIVGLRRLLDFYSTAWSPTEEQFSGFGRAEWREMARTVRPEITDEQFDAMWDETGMGRIPKPRPELIDRKERLMWIDSEARRLWHERGESLPWARAPAHIRAAIYGEATALYHA